MPLKVFDEEGFGSKDRGTEFIGDHRGIARGFHDGILQHGQDGRMNL